jgi:hypothetical protein
VELQKYDWMLLFSVAAVTVEHDIEKGWFRRHAGAIAAVISLSEDVMDILLRLPESWEIIVDARVRGIHDDSDIMDADPRFNRGVDDSCYAVVGDAAREKFALLLLINAVEAILLPQRIFIGREKFEACLFPGTA